MLSLISTLCLCECSVRYEQSPPQRHLKESNKHGGHSELAAISTKSAQQQLERMAREYERDFLCSPDYFL
jgi:hypothetical protein